MYRVSVRRATTEDTGEAQYVSSVAMPDTGVPGPVELRALREFNRRPQRELAVATGLSQAQYSRVEAGLQDLPTEKWLEIAPRLALGQGNRSGAPQRLRYALYRCGEDVLLRTRFVLDDRDRLGLFIDGRHACRTAGVLTSFGMGHVCAICCTPLAVEDVLFVSGEAGGWVVDAGSPGRRTQRRAETLGGLEFALAAMRRFLRESQATELTGSE